MLHFGDESLLLATGLGLRDISYILSNSKNDKEIEHNLRQKGEKYFSRYVEFKKYKQLTYEERLKEPIIPIITAMPGVGKTTIAKEVGSALGIGNIIGGDAFRSALREFISNEEHPEFFTSVYEGWKLYGGKTNENIIKGYASQAKIINRTIERIVADRGIRDGESMIFEYLHFIPSQFSSDVLNHPSVIPAVLRIEDKDIYRNRLSLRDKMTHLKGKAQRLIDVMDDYLVMQEYQCEDARKSGIPVVVADDWQVAFDLIMDIIFERIQNLTKHGSSYDEPSMSKRVR